MMHELLAESMLQASYFVMGFACGVAVSMAAVVTYWMSTGQHG